VLSRYRTATTQSWRGSLGAAAAGTVCQALNFLVAELLQFFPDIK
jgi:hypothetical protein